MSSSAHLQVSILRPTVCRATADEKEICRSRTLYRRAVRVCGFDVGRLHVRLHGERLDTDPGGSQTEM
jgi:hypothetical protein